MKKSVEFLFELDRPVKGEDVCVAFMLIRSIDIWQSEVRDELRLIRKLLASLLQEILEPPLGDELDLLDVIQFRGPAILRVVRVQFVYIKVQMEVEVELSDRF